MPFISKKRYNELVSKMCDAQTRVQYLESEFYVEDYFEHCPSSKFKRDNLVLKTEAKSFQKVVVQRDNFFHINYEMLKTFYTTKENYENHKPLIDKYQKEADKLRKKQFSKSSTTSSSGTSNKAKRKRRSPGRPKKNK